MAGLGLRRKCNKSNRKPKTLSEKREALEKDIQKYSVDTLEKMYPPAKPRMRSKSHRPSPVKMRPKPSGLDFEEVDARRILRPLSHAKYIHEPAHDTVVYIARRDGLVPLSSLCGDAATVLPSNVKLLQGRNIRLGKPATYVCDTATDRLLAVGGSRKPVRPGTQLRVLRVPRLVETEKKMRPGCPKRLRIRPCEIDSELANFAVEAVTLPSDQDKVDIRTIKRLTKIAEDEKKSAMPEKLTSETIVEHMIQKLEKVRQMEALTKLEEAAVVAQDNREPSQSPPIVKTKDEVTVNEDKRQMSERDMPNAEPSDSQKDIVGENSDDEDFVYPYKSSGQVFNPWKVKSDAPSAFNVNEIETRPIQTEQFKAKLTEWRKRALAGIEPCDVEECFCHEEKANNSVNGVSTSTFTTEAQTPATSGSQTPREKSQSSTEIEERKTKNKLNKVRRALKSLGVNFYEFDTEGERGDSGRVCGREFCRLGCICDAIAGKPVPPTHCGKTDCMFKCFCSEDAVKLASSRKVRL